MAKEHMAGMLKRLIVFIAVISYCAVLSAPLSVRVFAQESLPATEQPPTNEITTDPTEAPAPEQTTPQPSEPEAQQPEPTDESDTGPTSPTGSDSRTYTYNSETGLWENDYYTWDPVTKKTAPKTTQSYSYNPLTGRWDTEVYIYSPEQGAYVPRTVSTDSPPTPDATDEPSATVADSETTPPVPALTAVVPHPTSSLSVATYDSTADSYFDLFFDARISNTISASAQSGDASVLQNTTGGNATSGDALVTANVLNILQSTFGTGGLLPEIYTANIQGDYFGDIVIDPSSFSASNSDCECSGDLTVNSSVDAAILNDIDLLAQSGNATVSGNTTGGSATSGNATALANIVNMINSSIVSGESFVGILNVQGDFEGDVLIADDVIDELIAANVPTMNIPICNCGDIAADLDTSMIIDNDITATASSGTATVAHNTTGGDATSGTASTNVTVFNLTGRNVVGQDALLVFVEVLGEWVGFITNAPSGATAAALGNNITSNTTIGGDANYNIDTNAAIYNNVNVGAYSGNAEVSHNTTGGDATSGNASASVNVSNFVNSNFALSGWFGLLFIRVQGDWHGSVGTDTAYGDLPPSPGIHQATPPHKQQTKASALGSSINVPITSEGVRAYAVSFGSDDQGNPVLATATKVDPPANNGGSGILDNASASQPAATSGDVSLIAMSAVLALAFVLIFHRDWITSIFQRA